MIKIALCSIWLTATIGLHAQELDVLVGETVPLSSPCRLIGLDKEHFYLLDQVKFKDGKLGNLEGWSRSTLSREFSAPLDISVGDKENPELVGTSADQGSVQIFFTTVKKEENKLVLSVARYDGSGKALGITELARADRKSDGHTGRFMLHNDSLTHHIAVLNMRVYSDDMFGRALVAPDVHVLMLDGQGHTLYEQAVLLGEEKQVVVDAVGVDAKGTAYIAIPMRDKQTEGFFFGIHVVDGKSVRTVRTGQLTKDQNRHFRVASYPKGRGYESGCRFISDGSGKVHFAYGYGDKEGERLEGISLSGFSATGELASDKLYPVTVNYPADAKSKGAPAMAFAHIEDYAFLRDGRLNIYGVELFPQPARNGDNGFWGITLDPSSGVGAPWSCRVEREYGAQLNVPDPFLVELITLRGRQYILSNEMRDNIGKECSAQAPWKKVSVINQNSIPAYIRSDDGTGFGPSTALSQFPPAKGLHYAMAGALPGEEYVLQIASEDAMRFVRLRAGK